MKRQIHIKVYQQRCVKLKEKKQEIELLKQEREFLLKRDQLMDQFKAKKK